MGEPWDEIRDAAVATVKDALKGFLEREEVDRFVRDKSADYAREWWHSTRAATEDERREHLENLEHLKAQIRSEVDRLAIAVSVDARNTLTRVLETVGGVLIKVAPALLKAI